MARKHEICCCEMCGRDTPNKSKVCKHCMRGIRLHGKAEAEWEIDDREYTRDESVYLDVRRAMLEATE